MNRGYTTQYPITMPGFSEGKKKLTDELQNDRALIDPYSSTPEQSFINTKLYDRNFEHATNFSTGSQQQSPQNGGYYDRNLNSPSNSVGFVAPDMSYGSNGYAGADMFVSSMNGDNIGSNLENSFAPISVVPLNTDPRVKIPPGMEHKYGQNKNKTNNTSAFYGKLFSQLSKTKNTFVLSQVENSKIVQNANIHKFLTKKYLEKNTSLSVYKNDIILRWTYPEIIKLNKMLVLCNPEVALTQKKHIMIKCNKDYSIVFDKFGEIPLTGKRKNSRDILFIIPNLDITTKIKLNNNKMLITSLKTQFLGNESKLFPQHGKAYIIIPPSSFQIIDSRNEIVSFGVVSFEVLKNLKFQN